MPPGPLRTLRRHLFLKLYAAFVGIAMLCVLAAALTGSLLWERSSERPEARVAAELFVETLPAAPEAAQAELEARARRLDAAFALWSADGQPLLSAGPPMVAPQEDPHPRGGREGWFFDGELHGLRYQLSDGRWFAAATTGDGTRRPHQRFLLILLVLAGVVAAGCYPLARGITRRLEALEDGVARWGQGELSARAPVAGQDEVARVARRFNEAAARIEALVGSQRRMLASASHELRSPLARVRLALELAAEEEGAEARAALVVEAARDVDELDELIEDLLTAARLDPGGGPPALRRQPLDLVPLLAAEAERVGARTELPDTLPVRADPRLLRRAVRNLLENAVKHGGGEVLLAAGRGAKDAVSVAVSDRGPGVPEGERERIFEPFYRPADHDEGRHGGVGLGLALVRQIVRAHGGAVRHRPRDGGGSTFELDLPPEA